MSHLINLRDCGPVMRADIKLGLRSNYLYIGRPGIFGNPIRVGSECIVCGSKHAKGETLPCYEVWARDEIKRNFEFRTALGNLGLDVQFDGLTLACWCVPAKCHGEILLKLADEITEEDYEDFVAQLCDGNLDSFEQFLAEFETTDEADAFLSYLEGRE